MPVSNTMTREQFRTIRKDLRMTQVELAEFLGVSSRFISMLEAGHSPIERRTELSMRYLLLIRQSGGKAGLTRR
jgi:transcriptional regulator with XRE-family HTH domain